MISQLAQMFSSQGVLVQGTQYAPAPPKKKAASAIADSKHPGDSFAAKFDQASAKLQLSKGAQAKLAADGKPLSEDGKTYAVGGHVDIDASPVQGNPQATLRKAQTVQQAALAPADPSGQDQAVAAAVDQMAIQARTEINEKQADGQGGKGRETGTAAGKAGGAYARSPSPTGRAYSAVA